MFARISFNALLLVSFVVAVPVLTVARLGDASATLVPSPDAARPIPSYVLPEVVVTASPAGSPDVAAAAGAVRRLDRHPS